MTSYLFVLTFCTLASLKASNAAKYAVTGLLSTCVIGTVSSTPFTAVLAEVSVETNTDARIVAACTARFIRCCVETYRTCITVLGTVFVT